jgi:hypothetical protein
VGGNRRNNRHRWQQGRQSGGTFRGKTKEIADDIFDNTGQHDAATFNKSLKNIADHLQLELGNDVSEAVRNMTATIIDIPGAPSPTQNPNDPTKTIPPTDVDIFQWKRKFTKASDRLDKYEENMAKAYLIIYHQCSPALKNDLEASTAFPAIRDSQNVIALLRMIQGLCCSYDTRIQSVMATVASHKRLFTYYQKDGVDNHTYHREFLAHVETIETYGGLGAVGVTPTFITAKLKEMSETTPPTVSDITAPTDTERAAAIKAVRDEYLAALMLSGCNKDKYTSLRTDLRNDFAFGDDRYPKSIDQCLSLINRWAITTTPTSPRAATKPTQPVNDGKPEEALVFAQGDSKFNNNTKKSGSSDSSSHSSLSLSASTTKPHRVTNVRCLNCGQLGHTSAVCPNKKPAKPPAQIHAMADIDDASIASDASSVIILTQHKDGPNRSPISSDYLLLDSQSTLSEIASCASHAVMP